MKVIKVEDLTKSYKRYIKGSGLKGSVKSIFKREYVEIEAVKQISFEVEKGEIVGFIGSNGAGKTTTMKMLSGIIHPSSGIVEVLGFKPFDRKPEFQRRFSLVMGQKSQLWDDLPAIEGFRMNKLIYQIEGSQFEYVLNELGEILDVKDILNTPMRKLSLGQRMKCELLASLLHEPEILFLDEPTIGLDVVVQKRIRDFIKKYNSVHRNTIMLTSHYMEDVNELCDRLIIIDEGSILYDGSLDELKKKYLQNKYLKFIFHNKVEKEDLKRYGIIKEYDGVSVILEVPLSSHTKVAAQMLEELPVDDLDIAEISLTDIVRDLISK